MPAPREETSRAGCSKSKRKRKEVDHEPYAVRNAILDRKFRVDKVLEILNELPGVIKWSPFHIAAVNHLKADEANRFSFMFFPSGDDKISYLEHMIGVKIYEGL
ncbi:hypothetical protein Bca52824_053621 [Brassica carinata]|uniref:Uncharacterized protein n=1 Tax=Brassica carinata TaxID=52824 RepID=A0A8X7R602_BRACI|nr:hypothetical protein Bca52824_053621 [Brassica carinata]